MKREFIDSTLFMGMHHKDEKIRVACKNFFIKRFNKEIFMSLENVGLCDDIIWKFNREIQDSYYPFMDRLHTLMKITRIAYEEFDFECSNKKEIKKLKFNQKLTMGMVIAQKGTLYTIDKETLKIDLKEIKSVKIDTEELAFTEDLEGFYQESLKLRI